MNISYQWLRALAPSLEGSAQQLADRLALLGAPVDELEPLGAEIGDIVVARVAEVRPHPNADRLRVCSVDDGSGSLLQVVCGAPNVEAGAFYPFARVGATLPGGLQLKKAKLRGETSEGMLCSARELGLGRDHSGLMTLQGDFTPGARLVEAVGLDDWRLLVDVTPNRAELLSHWGVARELAPGGEAGLELPRFPGGREAPLELRAAGREGEAAGVGVRIDDPAGCPRYTAAVIRGVRVGPSPEWLASRLRAVGLRPINNVVDATNYVLFELGQPLHAFDLARLAGRQIVVRRARDGEPMRTLDGVERRLTAEYLVIADAERPVALAGVMGGENSEVSEETTELLIECALFEARAVRRTARGVGLSTDASYRFERGVDPELQPRALRRVVELILAVAGGEAEPVGLDVHPVPYARRVVELRPARVQHLLGVPLGAEEIAALLRPLGFGVERSGEVLRVDVPGARGDVLEEIDLVEEVARRRGYDSFPEALAAFRPSRVPEAPGVAVQRRLREHVAGWGLLEARTAGFAPAHPARVPLLNPLSAEESHLRDALAPGLLLRLEYNWARGARDIRLFEIGTVFSPGAPGEAPREEVRVAALLTGARRPPHWSGPAGSWELWDLKALLAELAPELGAAAVAAGDYPPLAPLTAEGERLALLAPDGAPLGGGGRVAAAVLDAPAWAEPVWLLEAVLPAAAPQRERRYQPVPEHPASERDLALLLPAAVSAGEVAAVIRDAAGPLLEAVFPFDRYAGKGIAEGTTSLAWRLRFRAPERTLTDAEVEAAVARVLRALEDGLGVRRR